MKKTLYEIFDEARSTELDQISTLLEGSDLSWDTLARVKSKVYAKKQLDHCSKNKEKNKERIITMKKENKFKRIHKGVLASAACVAMLLGCFVGYSAFFNDPSTDPAITQAISTTQTPLVATTITLDVNPSIEISADEEEKVIEVVALNKDAEIVVGDKELKGESLEVTVNTLIGSMISNGYINQTTNSVLLSVDNKDEGKGNAIKDKLNAEITDLINTESIGGTVISQTVSSDDKELSDLATEYGITLGKAKLIQTVMKIKGEDEFSKYAKLSITQLNKLMNESADKPKDENTYIGEEKALEIVLKELGLTKEELSAEPTINLVAVRGDVCYQIQIVREWTDEGGAHSYSYVLYVNAFNGTQPGEDVTKPNFSAQEAWECVLDNLGDKVKKVELIMQRFNDMESALPMTYTFAFELDNIKYCALVDAMDGTVIRVEKM